MQATAVCLCATRAVVTRENAVSRPAEVCYYRPDMALRCRTNSCYLWQNSRDVMLLPCVGDPPNDLHPVSCEQR